MIAQPRTAILLMLTAGALVAGTSLLAKILGTPADEGLPTLMISAGRFVFALASLSVVFAARPPLRPRLAGTPWGLHLARSVAGWGGVTCVFAAVAAMPVAEATAISFLSPLMAMALGAVMLGESIGARKLGAALLATLGAALVLRPGTEAFQPAGLLALAAAGLMGLEAVLIKRLSGREPTTRILLVNNVFGAVVATAAASLVWRTPTAGEWALLALLGAVMVTAQTLFILSMRRGEASLVMPAFYSVLVFAALYDFALFGTRPAASAILGAGLIVAGALLLALRPAADPARPLVRPSPPP